LKVKVVILVRGKEGYSVEKVEVEGRLAGMLMEGDVMILYLRGDVGDVRGEGSTIRDMGSA
jgi:hypothetical protein